MLKRENIENASITVETLERVARVLKTISHPVRLQVLRILDTEELMDVSTLCEKVGRTCEMSMMSHHLTKMRDHGLLDSIKRGKQVFYRIADRNILRIFECIEKCNF